MCSTFLLLVRTLAAAICTVTCKDSVNNNLSKSGAPWVSVTSLSRPLLTLSGFFPGWALASADICPFNCHWPDSNLYLSVFFLSSYLIHNRFLPGQFCNAYNGPQNRTAQSLFRQLAPDVKASGKATLPWSCQVQWPFLRKNVQRRWMFISSYTLLTVTHSRLDCKKPFTSWAWKLGFWNAWTHCVPLSHTTQICILMSFPF